MNKISKHLKTILEYIWFATAIIALAIAFYDTYTNSFKNALPYYGFFFLALFFYTSRRKERLKSSN